MARSTLDGSGETHDYGVARVSIAPRFADDDQGSGVMYAAGAVAGANGDAFVGDLYGSVGFGLSGDGLAAGVLVSIGADRVGGGFVPTAGCISARRATCASASAGSRSRATR